MPKSRNSKLPIRVASGGRTGVDRAALDVAREMKVPYGGWLPKGRRTEDGVLPMEYIGMCEMETEDCISRTRQNVIDSDFTVIIYRSVLEGGTQRTQDFCRNHVQQCCLIDLADNSSVKKGIDWVCCFIQVLADLDGTDKPITINFAGSRASKDHAIYDDAKRVIRTILETEKV